MAGAEIRRALQARRVSWLQLEALAVAAHVLARDTSWRFEAAIEEDV